MSQTVLANYSGPDAFVQAISNVPLIPFDEIPWTTYNPTPSNIYNNYLRFVFAIVFIPLIVFLVVLGYYLGHCCYLCSNRCPDCCKPNKLNKRRPDVCYLIVIAVFGAIALGGIITMLVYMLRMNSNLQSFINDGNSIQDFQNKLIAETGAGLADIEESQALANASLLNSTTSTQGKHDTQQAVNLLNGAQPLMNDAHNMVNSNLQISTVINPMQTTYNVASYVVYLIALLFLLFLPVLYAIIFAGSKPLIPCQTIFEVILLLLGFAFAVLGLALFTLSIGLACVCRDPNGLILQPIGTSSDITNYFLYCAPGAKSPLDNNFDQAYSKVAQILSLPSFVNHNTTEPSLVGLRASLIVDENLINDTKPDFSCTFAHNLIVQVEHTMCTDSLTENFFLVGILFIAVPIFLAWNYCLMPRTTTGKTLSLTKPPKPGDDEDRTEMLPRTEQDENVEGDAESGPNSSKAAVVGVPTTEMDEYEEPEVKPPSAVATSPNISIPPTAADAAFVQLES